MFSFFKKLCGCEKKPSFEERQKMAHEQDRQVREELTQKQMDKEIKDTFPASDPVTKY